MAIDRDKVLQAAQKFVEKKKYDKAVAEYQKIVAEDPNDARTLLKIGDLQSKMEVYPDAIGTYERVGKFYATQGFALKAIAVYKQIRELIAKHAPQLEERYGHITPKLAELYQQLGLTSDALAALDEVATRLQRQNKDQEAIDVFRKIVELDPTNPLPHLRLAEALSRAKDTELAVAEFGLAASQLVRLGRRDDALKVIERLLHHKPDPAHARIAAELYLARNQQNDGMQALSKLQICFQSNPKDLDTLALLARAFAAIGQAAKGIEVQKEMAKIAREQGKIELFKQLVDKLQRAAPNDEGVRQLVATVRGESEVQRPAPPPPRPPQSAYSEPAPPSRPSSPSSSIPIEDLDYESVETGDIEESDLEADPILLRSERPPPRAPAPPPRAQAPAPLPPRAEPAPYEPPARMRQPESSAPELIVAEDQYVGEGEYAEDAEPVDVAEQLAQVLSDAASFRRVR
ncbi:MAG TPA: tetratricopeptide repeat protein, partial [Polyangiaceae bacterium]